MCCDLSLAIYYLLAPNLYLFCLNARRLAGLGGCPWGAERGCRYPFSSAVSIMLGLSVEGAGETMWGKETSSSPLGSRSSLCLSSCQRGLPQPTPRICSPTPASDHLAAARPQGHHHPGLCLSCQQADFLVLCLPLSTCTVEACSLFAQHLWTHSGSGNPENVTTSGVQTHPLQQGLHPSWGGSPPLRLFFP